MSGQHLLLVYMKQQILRVHLPIISDEVNIFDKFSGSNKEEDAL